LSAGIYSTGTITASNATITSAIADGGVIEGSNNITLNDVTMSGEPDGIKIYHSESGDASGFTGTLVVNGGTMTATAGPAIYVENETAVITAENSAAFSASTNDIIASDDSSAVTFTATAETLTGNLVASTASTFAASLTSSTTLKGIVTNVALTIDATSKWNVTGNSVLTTLSDASGISGTTISNITGNGYTIYYKSSLNSALGAKTFTLAGGGYLKPE